MQQLRVGRYRFQRALEPSELAAVHRLNYQTFVREIPQHPDSGEDRLVDKFDPRNVYFVALKDGRVVGMISANGTPPFSVAARLADPEILTRPGRRPLEVRLLAVEPEERNGLVMTGLFWAVYAHAREQGAGELWISALAERERLYRRLGFSARGPAVPSGDLAFVPMSAEISQLEARQRRLIRRWRMDRPPESPRPPLSLLPGPVEMSPAVRAAFERPPLYHRAAEFLAAYAEVRRRLGDLVGGRDVALWNGSGSLANEVVAATLAAEPIPAEAQRRATRGLILVNGEFGARLAAGAARWGLRPRVLTWDWGRPWDWEEVDAALDGEPAGSWVWAVHHETSTGMLNDLPGLVARCRRRGLRVCVDCISSLGAVPIDLRAVSLATGVAGKALGAYAGLACVFADAAALPPIDSSRLPTLFDLGAALATEGPRHTVPSSVVLAAQAALADYATPAAAAARYERYVSLGATVRRRLGELGVAPLSSAADASPVVTTFLPPGGAGSEEFLARCHDWGYAVAGHSGYLVERGLVQIATMGALEAADLAPFFARLAEWLAARGAR